MSNSITDGLEIEDILNWYGCDYRKSSGSRGPQFNVRECPECHDERWKVYLGEESGLGNCFACDRKYNIWSFAGASINTEDKRTIAKALDDIKKSIGIKPKRQRVAAQVETDSTTLELPASYALPLHDGRTLNYLTERGITAEVQHRYKLRYCDFGHHPYMKDGEKRRQKFDNRVIIPVYNLDGDLVTFQGRDITGLSEKKYLFPIGLPGTARFLYNAHEVRAKRATEVILNEGVFDVAATQMACDASPETSRILAVGSFGKKLSYSSDGSPSQMEGFKLLARSGLKKVTIMWDGEAQVIDAALDASERLRSCGIASYIALLPLGKDPNEVPGDVTRKAWRDAVEWTPRLSVKWKLRNPYQSR